MFGLQLHKYLNEPTICLNSVGSTFSYSLHSSSLALVFDEFETGLQFSISNLFSSSLIYTFVDASLFDLELLQIPFLERMKVCLNQSSQTLISICALTSQSHMLYSQ
jgi:hypothetical protein